MSRAKRRPRPRPKLEVSNLKGVGSGVGRHGIARKLGWVEEHSIERRPIELGGWGALGNLGVWGRPKPKNEEPQVPETALHWHFLRLLIVLPHSMVSHILVPLFALALQTAPIKLDHHPNNFETWHLARCKLPGKIWKRSRFPSRTLWTQLPTPNVGPHSAQKAYRTNFTNRIISTNRRYMFQTV